MQAMQNREATALPSLQQLRPVLASNGSPLPSHRCAEGQALVGITLANIGICVYHENHKFFLLSLFWSIVLSVLAIAALLPKLLHAMNEIPLAFGTLTGPAFWVGSSGAQVILAVCRTLVSRLVHSPTWCAF